MRVITAAAALVPVLLLAGCGSPGGSEESTGQAIPSSDGLAPKGRTIPGLEVQRVVDGDTIKVDIDGESLTVRMVGIDTPETVKPDSPVECFGPEASDFAAELLTDATVTLEIDESQGATDQYGRALAYVWRELPDGSLSMFNLEAVAGGYAEARQYGPDAYAWKTEFDAAEDAARSAGAGQWGACRG
jgi:micrococcal nuclease